MVSPDPIISIHIPKTAGTHFRALLEQTYGARLAMMYGDNDSRTHPLLRGVPQKVPADTLARLADEGIEVIHGHFLAARFSDAVPDPARYWVWLREPIEHTISHYHFLVGMRQPGPMAEFVRSRAATLREFLMLDLARNLQSKYTNAVPIDGYGFVGVTELFDELVPLLGLEAGRTRRNANRTKPVVSAQDRREIVGVVREDVALYSWAMETAIRKLGRRKDPPQESPRR